MRWGDASGKAQGSERGSRRLPPAPLPDQNAAVSDTTTVLAAIGLPLVVLLKFGWR